MVVPYGDPRSPHFRKCAFDAGEDGLGRNANSLELGCDCLGAIHYFDAHLVDDDGSVETISKAICLHEEDSGEWSLCDCAACWTLDAGSRWHACNHLTGSVVSRHLVEAHELAQRKDRSAAVTPAGGVVCLHSRELRGV